MPDLQRWFSMSATPLDMQAFLTTPQVKEAFVDSTSADVVWGRTPPRLTFEGWVECLGRCAFGLYGALQLMKSMYGTRQASRQWH